jgi:hypothetical protein
VLIALVALAIVIGVVPRSVGDLADRSGSALTELRR